MHSFFLYVYFCSLHVSGRNVPIIMRINCINVKSGICHSVYTTVWYAGQSVSFRPAYQMVIYTE